MLQASVCRVRLTANQSLNHLLLLLASACQGMKALLEDHARLVDLVITEGVTMLRVGNALVTQIQHRLLLRAQQSVKALPVT